MHEVHATSDLPRKTRKTRSRYNEIHQSDEGLQFHTGQSESKRQRLDLNALLILSEFSDGEVHCDAHSDDDSVYVD